MYQSSIGFGKKYQFGIELEFGKVQLMSLYPKLLTKSVPVCYHLRHKDDNPKYDVWYLDVDPTVSESINKRLVGGELSSRILTDDSKNWEEIKRVCETLKENKAISTISSSTHITVDISKYKTEADFFRILSKIIMAYEIEMSLFYMGDQFLIRKTKGKYAANMSFRLLNSLHEVNFNDKDFFNQLREKTQCFRTRDAINLSKLPSKGLIEIRYPNGTLNAETIQRNIQFTLGILNAIEQGLFDEKELDEIIDYKKRDSSYWQKLHYLLGNEKDFQKLTSIITQNEEQAKELSYQYQKVLQTRN